MNYSLRVALLCAPLVAAPASVRGQTAVPAPGFATVNLAGLGNATTIAGESRIPILSRNLSWDPSSTRLHIRATGTRGAVRQLDIEVRGPRTGARFDLGRDSATVLRVRLDEGGEINAESGAGT